jgi:hypothetical protein
VKSLFTEQYSNNLPLAIFFILFQLFPADSPRILSCSKARQNTGSRRNSARLLATAVDNLYNSAEIV